MTDRLDASAAMVPEQIRPIAGVEGLRSLVGFELGASSWTRVEQSTVSAFADATADRQWIHVDPVRATTESPFGGTIAHGYLLLSLIPVLSRQIFTVRSVRFSINYGLDSVRFVSPVRSDSCVRLRMTLSSLRNSPTGVIAAYDCTFDLDSGPKPACVARTLILYVT